MRARRATGAALIVLAVGLACTSAAPESAPGTNAPARTPISSLAPPSTIRIIAVGDIMMARRVGDDMRATGDFARPFRRVADRLAAADFTFGNLESTLARLGPPTQGDAFAADPRALEGLLDAGIDAVSLANNHVGDFGPRSTRATLRALDTAGVGWFGAGPNEERARRPLTFKRGGVTFGLLGFNSIGETPRPGPNRPGAVRIAMQPRTGPLNRDDLDRFTDDVRALKRRVDVVLVVPHWGAQYTFEVHPNQRMAARALIRAGADAIIGGHSHWVGGFERYRGAPIVYSLGNFVFDMDLNRRTREAIAVELTFRGAELATIEPLPVVIGDDWSPRFARGERARSILADVQRASDTSFTFGSG